MSEDVAAELRSKLGEIKTAVTNARARGRLRGESVELTIAGDRIVEAEEILARVQ